VRPFGLGVSEHNGTLRWQRDRRLFHIVHWDTMWVEIKVNCTGTNVSLCSIHMTTPYTTITTGSRVLPVKIIGPQLVKNFPAFYRTRRFITAFTRARHLSISWTRPIQSMSLFPLLIDPLKYYSPIYALVFEVVSGFLKRTLYAPILSPISATFLFWSFE